MFYSYSVLFGLNSGSNSPFVFVQIVQSDQIQPVKVKPSFVELRVCFSFIWE